MKLLALKLAGLAVTITCWWWALKGPRTNVWDMALIWCAPLLVYPIIWLGRRALERQPTTRHAEWTNVLVHYATMISFGVGIFPAVRVITARPPGVIPFPPLLGYALVLVTGAAACLTVLNLAIRGLGAPFAIKLSSRLASDWMYAWTRNPMVLCTAAWLFSLGLWRQSLWFVIWVAVILLPGWLLLVKKYEERELELRFGPSYIDYRRRTPFLFPRKPRPAKERSPAATV